MLLPQLCPDTLLLDWDKFVLSSNLEPDVRQVHLWPRSLSKKSMFLVRNALLTLPVTQEPTQCSHSPLLGTFVICYFATLLPAWPLPPSFYQ